MTRQFMLRLLLVGAACLPAGTSLTESRPGALFLTKPLSVRQIGMGNVSIAGEDVLRAWCNPSVLSAQETTGEFALTGSSNYGGMTSSGGFGGGWRIPSGWIFGSAGSFYSVNSEEIDEYGFPTGESLGHSCMAVALLASRGMRSFTFGIAVKGVSEELLGETAMTAAVDIGIGMRRHNWEMGLATRNIGPGLRQADDPFSFGESLPLEIRAGLSRTLEHHRVTPCIEYVKVTGRDGAYNIGADWWPQAEFGARVGLTHASDSRNRRFTAGLSGVYRSYRLDYALATHTLGMTHNVCVSYAIGRPPPEPPPGGAYEPGVNIAVVNLEALANVSSGDARLLSDLLRTQVGRIRTFTLLERQKMDAILAEQNFQETGCTTEECAVEMGKLLNVRLMMTGSFGRMLGKYIVNIRVVDVETGKVVHTNSVSRKSADALQAQLAPFAEAAAASLIKR